MDEPEISPLTIAQAEELDDRLDEMDQDQTPGVSWETVLAQIRERRSVWRRPRLRIPYRLGVQFLP